MVAWNLWTGVPRVKLWEAVALVLEIDPNSLELLPHGWMAGGNGREIDPFFVPRSFPSKEKCRAFEEALGFAGRATSYSGPIHVLSTPFVGMSMQKADVALAEVVTFFVGCQWPDIPAPLLALQSVAGRTAPPAPAVPVAGEPEPGVSANGTPKKWTDERLQKLQAYRDAHGTTKAAEHFGVTTARVRALLPTGKPAKKGYSVFTRRMK